MSTKIPIEISARHIHLSPQHLKELFGENYHLTPLKDLSQPGQFACKETLEVLGNKGGIPNVRIVGPLRGKTQVELSFTDARNLGLVLPLRLSGNLVGSGECTLRNPQNGKKVHLTEGAIVAMRHLHATPREAKELGLKQHEKIKVKIPGPRGLIFMNVIVRIDEKSKLAVQLDTDEANAAGVTGKEFGELIKNEK